MYTITTGGSSSDSRSDSRSRSPQSGSRSRSYSAPREGGYSSRDGGGSRGGYSSRGPSRGGFSRGGGSSAPRPFNAKKSFKKDYIDEKLFINKEAGVRKVGFMTQSDLKNFDLDDYVAVYCPHSYAFSGEMFLVPRENVKPLEMPSAEAMKLIVSGGVSSN